jgi:hypothetical protein
MGIPSFARFEITEGMGLPAKIYFSNCRNDSLSLFLGILCFSHLNFQHHWLAFRDQFPLITWQFGKQRQFHPLQNRFNPPQMMSANGNLVRGKDELEVLLVAATVEFRKDEMIVRQQQ